LGHILTMLFAMICSVFHSGASFAHNDHAFVPPAEFVHSTFDVPVANHASLARRNALNSYSEDACLSSCLLNTSSTNGTSQPRLILRAQR
jgi:hypothetical protein